MAAQRVTGLGLYVELQGGIATGCTVVVRPARRGDPERFRSWLRGGESYLVR